MLRLNMRILFVVLAVPLLLVPLCSSLWAAPFSHVLSFQGRLAAPDGKPLPDGPYAVRFSLYNVPVGGLVLWGEAQGVTQVGGTFVAYLGTVAPFPAALFTGGDLWLGIRVGADPEMPTRIQLTPSPWALYAADSAHAALADLATNAAHADAATNADTATWAIGCDKADRLDGFPIGVIPQGPGSGLNADMTDGFHAGTAPGQLAVNTGLLCNNLNADLLDGMHSGNNAGQIAVSNGTLCTNLNADKWDGHHWGDIYPNADTLDGRDSGNGGGMIPVSNGALCATLNADLHDGYHAGNASGQVPVSNGVVSTNLNADMVDGVHAGSMTQIAYDGTLLAGGSVTLKIPHYTLWTLQLSSGWPQSGGVCFVQGFENDWWIGVTYIKYNGDGTSAVGGTEGYEGDPTVLASFGNGGYSYIVRCPDEIVGDHNIVLTAAGVELKYRLIY